MKAVVAKPRPCAWQLRARRTGRIRGNARDLEPREQSVRFSGEPRRVTRLPNDVAGVPLSQQIEKPRDDASVEGE